ncbi:hypothetical protein [Pseudomonas umsongensis]|uniref:hypothetical protein n=1 Tax=Pseudomonas umsongensis TaxID=198618 RepID=UPI00177A8EC9|nr:hypothetical protein [Pseudomonas umsongensis]MBT9572659.1 hypothetical protein [Pseudomonas umsongensis]
MSANPFLPVPPADQEGLPMSTRSRIFFNHSRHIFTICRFFHHIPVPGEYRNADQAHMANRGLHNHTAQADSEMSQPSSHTDHRALYDAALHAINDQTGKTS